MDKREWEKKKGSNKSVIINFGIFVFWVFLFCVDWSLEHLRAFASFLTKKISRSTSLFTDTGTFKRAGNLLVSLMKHCAAHVCFFFLLTFSLFVVLLSVSIFFTESPETEKKIKRIFSVKRASNGKFSTLQAAASSSFRVERSLLLNKWRVSKFFLRQQYY